MHQRVSKDYHGNHPSAEPAELANASRRQVLEQTGKELDREVEMGALVVGNREESHRNSPVPEIFRDSLVQGDCEGLDNQRNECLIHDGARSASDPIWNTYKERGASTVLLFRELAQEPDVVSLFGSVLDQTVGDISVSGLPRFSMKHLDAGLFKKNRNPQDVLDRGLSVTNAQRNLRWQRFDYCAPLKHIHPAKGLA